MSLAAPRCYAMASPIQIAAHRGMVIEPRFSSHQANLVEIGGGGGIRTHGGFNTSPVFKTGAINRSTTPPFAVISFNRSQQGWRGKENH